jgi:peroxiredoxin
MAQRVPPERQAIMERHIAQLRDGIAKSARTVGDQAPAFTLNNANGKAVDVSALWKTRPVVVNFYRGGWCPYCNLELRALQQVVPQIEALGATLVAVSPEKPDDAISTAEKNALTFPVLSDPGQKVGRAFGLVYTFSEELISAYKEFGLDIPGKNGAKEWALPISATYVVEGGGTIVFANTDADYRDRADPAAVLAALRQTAPVA